MNFCLKHKTNRVRFTSFIVLYLFIHLWERDREAECQSGGVLWTNQVAAAFEFDFIIRQCHCSLKVGSDKLSHVPAQLRSLESNKNIAIWHYIMFRLLK